MDKKLRKNILEILKNQRARLSLYSLKDTLASKYNYSDNGVIGSSFSNQTLHIIRVLEGESLIKKEKVGTILLGGDPDMSVYLELTAEGYKEFSPWYEKFWSFLNNDFAKLLSLISIILSIIATWLSFHK